MRSPSSNDDKTSNNMKYRRLTNKFQLDSFRSGEQIIATICWGINAK
ncbi:MAG: hypothetical protein HRT54_07875 [Colwellia sp.]|nr:hypothetical protein [Colwellia sp.]